MTDTMNYSSRSPKLHALLKENFGHTSFRFEQWNIINSILDGRDTLAVMPTGGGKSICYQLPSLYLKGATLVISPLISLMKDQVINLNENGIAAHFLNSSLTSYEKKEVKRKILQGETKIIYCSPEGVLSPSMEDFLNQIDLSLIAVDEAHCISQWGHEFRKDYTRLGELKQKFPQVPIVALTATADAKTREDIMGQLQFAEPRVFVSSFDRPNINYMILDRKDEMKQLHTFIQENHPHHTGIVYCLSRAKVEKTATALQKLGHIAFPYHAGLTQDERSHHQELFNREEKIIMVATVAFGMGIDRPDVRFVAHLDLPKSVESYYQETGRAGRDGKKSTAWMIYGLQDVMKISQMLEQTEADENYKKMARHKLDAMLSLCETASCRRRYLLGYFGENSPENCSFCDSCLHPPSLCDATEDAKKLISAIYRTNQIFGAGHIIDVLRGSMNKKILEYGHDKLPLFGLGKNQSPEHWNMVLRQLINLNYITVKNWEFRSLGLTGKCHDILKGGQNLLLRIREVSAREKGKKSKTKTPAHANAIAKTNNLLNSLKELRKNLAREKNVPPYVIFHDKTLHEMCLFLPRTSEEFLMLNGVGQSKSEKYGEIFLSTIREFQS